MTIILLTLGFACLAGVALLPARRRPPAAEAQEMVDVLERQATGDIGTYEWDDVIGVAKSDPYLESVRLRIDAVVDRHPSADPDDVCDATGREELRQIAEEIRGRYL